MPSYKIHVLIFLAMLASTACDKRTVYAVIGDYGTDSPAQAAVVKELKATLPDYILTLGDNNYPSGSADTLDVNVGQYFSDFIYPYHGAYGQGATTNRFYPILGNHDWLTDEARPYLNYFELPGNERYYDINHGSVHFFMLDSDPNEPDGIDAGSIQAAWLQEALANSTATWKIVLLHHSPYSSGKHGSNVELHWPFAQWGADLVLSGHDHTYERIERDGIFYIVNGVGGKDLYDFQEPPVEGSLVRLNDKHGFVALSIDSSELTLQYISSGEVRDAFSLNTN